MKNTLIGSLILTLVAAQAVFAGTAGVTNTVKRNSQYRVGGGDGSLQYEAKLTLDNIVTKLDAMTTTDGLEPENLNSGTVPVDVMIQSESLTNDMAQILSDFSLEIGTDVQAYDADLTTYAGITPAANVQSLLSAADYAAMKALLDMEIGTDIAALGITTTITTFSSLIFTDGVLTSVVLP